MATSTGYEYFTFAEEPSFLQVAKMYRLGVRRFSTTVRKAAEAVAQMEGPNPYGIKVSTAQGVVKGLVGGKFD
jgi:hypothetical protein